MILLKYTSNLKCLQKMILKLDVNRLIALVMLVLNKCYIFKAEFVILV